MVENTSTKLLNTKEYQKEKNQQSFGKMGKSQQMFKEKEI